MYRGIRISMLIELNLQELWVILCKKCKDMKNNFLFVITTTREIIIVTYENMEG